MLKRFAVILTTVFFCSFAFVFAEEVKISRDSYGVPHIYASSEEGLTFGQGYAQACDRLFQLEMIRLSSSGKMSESLGADYIDADKMYLRYFPSGDELRLFVKSFNPEQKNLFRAFAEGINARIAEVEAEGTLPEDFAEYGVQPVKWTETDVFRVYFARHKYIYDSKQELVNAMLLKKLIQNHGQIDGTLIFNSIVFTGDSLAGTVAGNFSKFDFRGAEEAYANVDREVRFSQKLTSEFGIPYGIGSYAVALAASKSKSGNSMLLAGPSFGFGDPSFLYECSLHSKEIHAAGIQSVGIPGLLIAQNEFGAWTLTGGNDNQTDYYIEMLNPENLSQYRYNDEWKDISKKTYTINVKDSDPVSFEVLETLNGIIVSTDLSDPKNPVAYSKRTSVSYSDLASSWMNSFDALKSYTTDAFIEAFRNYPISANIFYINQKNQPAYFHSGKYPVRADGVDLRIPSYGTGQTEWQGFLPFNELPESRLPSRGFYADWNSKPSHDWNNGEKSYLWGSQNRVDAIRRYIDINDKFTFGDLDVIDRVISYTDIYAVNIKPLLVEKLSSSEDADVIEASGLIGDWDNRPVISEDGVFLPPGGVIFHEWMKEFAKRVCPELDGDFAHYAINEYGAPFIYNVLSDVILPYNFLKDSSSSEAAVAALLNAVSNLKAEYGDDMDAWKTALPMQNYEGPYPKSELSQEMKRFYAGNRASAILMWEVSRFWIKGVGVVPPGSGEFIGDPSKPGHKDDQLDLYENRKYKNLLFYDEDIRHQEESVQIIQFNEEQ